MSLEARTPGLNRWGKRMHKCEVAIVGAGPAGIACGYVLAKAGVDVIILERGEYPGAKNMFGGIFFAEPRICLAEYFSPIR